MILTLKTGVPKKEVDRVLAKIKELKFTPSISRGAERVVIGVIGEHAIRHKEIFESMEAVDFITPISKPYKLVSREFKKENTKPDVFRAGGGEQKELPMMSQSGSYFYYKGKDFQSVALAYGKGSVSMYVFLPDERTTLDQFERNLTPENWDTWMRSFAVTPGDLQLPRFKIEWNSGLNDALKSLGMAEAFDPQRADFSQIAKVSSGNRLFISQVRHKTWGEVNEEGTEAAAVTSVTIGVTSVQQPREKFVMKVDRPFFFAIRDNTTGVLLFMGSVTNPE